MDIFKGLLFLHGHINPADAADFIEPAAQARREYGARTAATDLAPPLGNRGLSRQWFGRESRDPAPLPPVGCVAGGCG